MKRDVFYLENILDEIDILHDILSGKDIDDYLSDEILKRAVTKTFENIGESVKNVSEEVKANNPEIDWRSISGLRDIISHRYHGIDHRLIWDLYENKIGELEMEIRTVLEKIEDDTDPKGH